MALYEEAQDLVLQEIDRIMKSSASLGHDMLSHEEDFIKFRCMMAFLVRETCRLPVAMLTFPVRDSTDLPCRPTSQPRHFRAAEALRRKCRNTS